jgi:CheY-like chemotaxis protein
VRELGLDAYIVKPVRRAELLAAISTAMAGRDRTNGVGAGAKIIPDADLCPAAMAATLAGASGLQVSDDLIAEDLSGIDLPIRIHEPIATLPPSLIPWTAPIVLPISILLVDDSADNRLLISSYLKRMPFGIDEAENGQVAFQRATTRRYDLILMDMHMPLLDGLDATRMIRDWELLHDAPRTPILILTASALEEDVRRALVAGADAHVSKPISKVMLLEAMRKFLPATGEATAKRTEAFAT